MSLAAITKAIGNPLPHQRVHLKEYATVPVGKVGYKKVSTRNGEFIVKLLVTEEGLIPGGSLRDDCYYGKFRVRQAMVLDICDENGKFVKSVTNTSYSPSIRYVVGKLVNPDFFTTDICDDYGHGIHMFNNIKSAYNL